MQIEEIVRAIRGGCVRITDHADEEVDADRLSFDEVFFSVIWGEIIEPYPDDKPYASCLVYGSTLRGDPVHSVWGHNRDNGWVVLITVYRSDPDRWGNWRSRRSKR